MEWTKDDVADLIAFTQSIDSDDIKVKEQIKKVLLDNRYIIHTLNNKELEAAEAEADEYYGINILPYYIISPTQTNIQNFICFEVNYDELNRYNSVVKKLNVVFYVLCNQKNIIDEDTGVARHDLLASLIQYDFNFTNYLGSKLRLVSDVSNVVDTEYACRILTFEQITDNNLVKTPYKDGTRSQARLANKI